MSESWISANELCRGDLILDMKLYDNYPLKEQFQSAGLLPLFIVTEWHVSDSGRFGTVRYWCDDGNHANIAFSDLDKLLVSRNVS